MKRVLVVGDVIADVYERCKFRKMCPDAPGVPAVVRQTIETRPGGAANVALNLSALSPDVRVSLIGAIGHNVGRLIKQISHNRVDMSHCQVVEEMVLTKRRIYSNGELKLRLDRGDRLSSYDQGMVFGSLKAYLANNDPDLILLSDYGHGTVGPEALELLLQHRERLMVDTKMTDLSPFEGSLLCKLNANEWEAVTATEPAPERFFRYMVVTAGGLGSVLKIRRELRPGLSATDSLNIPAHRVRTHDVCGCGDTFLAGLASSMLQNDDPFTAMCFAGAAAATVVTQEGTAVADRDAALELLGQKSETESEAR